MEKKKRVGGEWSGWRQGYAWMRFIHLEKGSFQLSETGIRDSDILLVGTNWPHHLGSSHSTFTYIYIYTHTYIHCEIPYFVYFE